ncbi:efflux RND transporter periplasmic adaptor subunit [Flavobacterium sp.]|uniref:efflux RND transporter periplasmic adaptor subunit n=1 Tax=Flavobacterium sp. TaxID=239 RepID=UPI00286A3DF9|nr:efflux RND transporter periplasmic adaptor subunit [Flavobacterium sp.]
MKKILLLSAFTILFVACSQKESSTNIDKIIESKDLTKIQAKRVELQAQLTKLDEAIATLDTTKVEVLVAIQTLKDTIFNHYLEIQGNVDTKENILIQPEIPGTLVSLNAIAGQHVSKGQILGRVDDGGASQQLASLENQYNLAKTTFERQKNLWDQKIGSEIQFLNAQTQMISAQKAVAQAKAQLSKTVIRAPFTGVIDEVFVERGEVVAAGPTGLMRIVNLSNMYVSTLVPETYIGKLKVGTVVDVTLNSLGKTYKGKIRQIASSINPNNRSFNIEVAVPNPDNLLRPNQVAKLKIVDYINPKAVVVPTNVVQEDGKGNHYVYTVTDNKGKTGIAKKVIVEAGKSANNVTEILSGLSEDDTIVTEGVNTISEGMQLNF